MAPDKFAGSLSAVQAASALSDGWAEVRPADELVQLPMSDGGPGFLEVLGAALSAGSTLPVTVTDPLRRPVQATVLLSGDAAYLESAQAVGLHLLRPAERDPERADSAGLARLLIAAVDTGAERIVVGLGGSATNDGGRGMLEALHVAERSRPGLIAAIRRTSLVIAADVANPLLGPAGATAVYGPQKGATREAVARLEGRMLEWVSALPGLVEVAGLPGAGAAGGLGASLLWLGGHYEAGAVLVAAATGLAQALAAADLVLTGEGAYDSTSLRAKVVGTIAAAAAQAALPCLLVAGRVMVGAREAAAHGVDEALALADIAGSIDAAMAQPARWAAVAAGQLALQWSPG